MVQDQTEIYVCGCFFHCLQLNLQNVFFVFSLCFSTPNFDYIGDIGAGPAHAAIGVFVTAGENSLATYGDILP